ncbi:MAG: ABC transporter ATP-binding protein [Oscillospiraceae bacterium]|nr:ABC transporter ATP-binding protein [Oscillospiraceae bacterium]
MKTKKEKDALLRLLREAKSIRWHLALGCLLSMVLIVCVLFGPKLLGNLVQELIDYFPVRETAGYRITEILLPGLGLLLGIYLLKAVVDYLKMLVLNRAVSRYFTCNLRIKISDKIQRLPVSYVDNTPVGDILSRMTDDVSYIGNSLHSVIDTVMTGFLQIIAITVMLVLENWMLAIVVVLFMPLSILLSTVVANKSEAYYHRMFRESGELYAVVEEAYTNYDTTKAYNLEDDCARRHGEINRRQIKSEAKANYLSSIVQPIIAASNSLAYIAINLLGGYLIVRHGVSVGVVVTVVLYARQFSEPLEQIANGISTLQQSRAAAKRVVGILDLPEEAPVAAVMPDSGDGAVEFRDVDFSYSADTPLIRNFSVHVERGQHVAIVGPTGAGKTTLVNLLMRFYDVNSGEILLGGRNLADYSRESARDLFAMVLQDTWLFRGTIAENVAYGRPEATREEIVTACDEAYCDHFIRTLPKGYDTELGSTDAAISGGQKQLLTIARALLADRELLILDEATSNVDTRTELLIQKAMDKLMQGKTCFIIAHRLSTIVDADLILVIRNGQIVEQGKHAELLGKQGFYSEIYQSQYAI